MSGAGKDGGLGQPGAVGTRALSRDGHGHQAALGADRNVLKITVGYFQTFRYFSYLDI